MKNSTQLWVIIRTSGLSVAALLSSSAIADSREEALRATLQQFETHTAEFMRRIPKKTPAGVGVPRLPQLGRNTSKYDLINAAMDRLEMSQPAADSLVSHLTRITRVEFNLRAPIESHDRAEELVDTLKYRTLEKMDSAQLLNAQLDQQPWSDSYWPIAKGMIAWRYGDPAYPASDDWKANADFLLNPQNTCSVDQLSPAEKYDLLVGDPRNSMKRAMLKDGKRYHARYGKVETWMGLCHGWAAASYMAKRPEKSVQVVAADGHTQIRFLPSDLKALTTLLWANGQFENRFIGMRCEDKNPPTDENGRSLDPACYGENPGTWHLSVVNQIGAARRSFVMDAQHDTEIWNQPIYGYKYTYFNPQTRQPVDSLAKAEIALADFTTDKFKQYRSPSARSVVGIAMDLTYVAENEPSTEMTDGPENDALVTVQYLYDLELDSDRQILGGEWYSNAHPGFLWTPTPGARAVTVGDRMLPEGPSNASWDGSSAIPADWANAIRYSSDRGQPLAMIVDTLGIIESLQ